MALLSVVQGCIRPNVKPVVVADESSRGNGLPSPGPAILLAPILSFDNSSFETADDTASRQSAETVETTVSDAATKRGFALIRESKLNDQERKALEGAKTSIRASGCSFKPIARRTECLDAFRSAASLLGESAHILIVPAIRIAQSTSHGGSTGDGAPIIAGRRTTNLALIVIDLEKYKVPWAREVFFRSSPRESLFDPAGGGLEFDDPSHAGALKEALTLLLAEFSVEKTH